MTNEELNTALYEKMFAEQQRYREWLLSQPPDEILNHCYEFTVREDIRRFCSRTARLPMCSRILRSEKQITWTTSVTP